MSLENEIRAVVATFSPDFATLDAWIEADARRLSNRVYEIKRNENYQQAVIDANAIYFEAMDKRSLLSFWVAEPKPAWNRTSHEAFGVSVDKGHAAYSAVASEAELTRLVKQEQLSGGMALIPTLKVEDAFIYGEDLEPQADAPERTGSQTEAPSAALEPVFGFETQDEDGILPFPEITYPTWLWLVILLATAFILVVIFYGAQRYV
jgi:hypothetical protein